MNGVYKTIKATAFILVSSFFASLNAYSQLKELKIKSPAKDSLTVHSPTLYFQGIADPAASLYMQGQPVNIYSTGVFAALIPIVLGNNQITVQYGEGRDTTTRTFIIEYQPTPRPTATTEFKIEQVSLLPKGNNLWLQPGDKLQIEVKATPGMEMHFFRDIPMTELDENQKGVKGIYRGEYTIQKQDKLHDLPIQVVMKNPVTNESVQTESNETVRFLTQEHDLIGLTGNGRVGLNFSLGSDRLGGAKMGFLPKDIPLEITGKMQNMYRIRLADQVQAYVSENDVRVLPSVQFRPQSITGSWSVRPSERGDLISVGLSQKLPYVSRMLENPAKIEIDIFGATSNSNWITQKSGLQSIRNVWYEQIAKDIFRIHIELLENQHWGHEIGYRGNSLFIRVKPSPASLKLSDLKIAVDAGHGGTNRGAIGMTGVEEKDLNLSMATKLTDLLTQKGAEVILTRPGNSYTTNTKRLETLQSEDPDILISIHCNAAGNPMASGTSTYYRHQALRPLSVFIQEEMLKLGLEDFGNVGGFNFTLNSPTEYPTVLVEVAFMSNPADEERLLDSEFHDQVAESILKGLEKFLASSKKQ